MTKDEQIAFLTERLAITLVVVSERYGDDWNPWGGEGIWEDEGSLGDEIRRWPRFRSALAVVGLMLKRQANKEPD